MADDTKHSLRHQDALAVINCGRLTSAVIAGSTASTKLTSFAPMLPVKKTLAGDN